MKQTAKKTPQTHSIVKFHRNNGRPHFNVEAPVELVDPNPDLCVRLKAKSCVYVIAGVQQDVRPRKLWAYNGSNAFGGGLHGRIRQHLSSGIFTNVAGNLAILHAEEDDNPFEMEAIFYCAFQNVVESLNAKHRKIVVIKNSNKPDKNTYNATCDAVRYERRRRKVTGCGYYKRLLYDYHRAYNILRPRIIKLLNKGSLID